MATKSNAAYFGTTGTLSVAGDDYTAAVTSCAIVPNTPTASTTDIGGGVTQFVGQATWQAQVAYNQDWRTAGSLSQKLIEWHGQVKTFTYTPDSGALPVTFDARCVAGQIGGGAQAVHTATVNLPVNGQPLFTPAATAPTITAATPTAAAAGSMVTIKGSGFTGVTGAAGVKIGATNATSYTIVDPNTIVAVVPAGSAGSAPIVVTNATGASAAFPYTRGA